MGRGEVPLQISPQVFERFPAPGNPERDWEGCLYCIFKLRMNKCFVQGEEKTRIQGREGQNFTFIIVNGVRSSVALGIYQKSKMMHNLLAIVHQYLKLHWLIITYASIFQLKHTEQAAGKLYC